MSGPRPTALWTSPLALGGMTVLAVGCLLGARASNRSESLPPPQVFAELGAVYDGPVVQTQDLTVFNVTREAVVARQAKVSPQLPPIPGVPRVGYTPSQPKPPAWWAEALIPVD